MLHCEEQIHIEITVIIRNLAIKTEKYLLVTVSNHLYTSAYLKHCDMILPAATRPVLDTHISTIRTTNLVLMNKLTGSLSHDQLWWILYSLVMRTTDDALLFRRPAMLEPSKYTSV